MVNDAGVAIFGDGLSQGGPVEIDPVSVVDDAVEDGVGESRRSAAIRRCPVCPPALEFNPKLVE